MTSFHQLNAPIIKVWSTPLVESRGSNTEEHRHPECGFIKQWEWTIDGTNIKFCILIRRCVCENKTDKSHMLQKKILRPSEFGDGVELHLYSNDNRQMCDYSVKKKPIMYDMSGDEKQAKLGYSVDEKLTMCDMSRDKKPPMCNYSVDEKMTMCGNSGDEKPRVIKVLYVHDKICCC